MFTFYDDVMTFSPLLWHSYHVLARYYKRETEGGHVRKTDLIDLAYINNLSGFYFLRPKTVKPFQLNSTVAVF